jgi:hypothetical protein
LYISSFVCNIFTHHNSSILRRKRLWVATVPRATHVLSSRTPSISPLLVLSRAYGGEWGSSPRHGQSTVAVAGNCAMGVLCSPPLFHSLVRYPAPGWTSFRAHLGVSGPRLDLFRTLFDTFS